MVWCAHRFGLYVQVARHIYGCVESRKSFTCAPDAAVFARLTLPVGAGRRRKHGTDSPETSIFRGFSCGTLSANRFAATRSATKPIRPFVLEITMSLFGSLYTAVSGLNAQATAFGNISDNVANSQTVGFKGVNTSFQDYLTTSTATSNEPSPAVQTRWLWRFRVRGSSLSRKPAARARQGHRTFRLRTTIPGLVISP